MNNNGRIVTSVSISLSKPSSGRQTNKITMAPKPATKSVKYSRDQLVSLRSAPASLQTPEVQIDGRNKIIFN